MPTQGFDELLHVGRHERVIASACTVALHVRTVVSSDVHLERVLDSVADLVKTDFFHEVVEKVPGLGFAAEFNF